MDELHAPRNGREKEAGDPGSCPPRPCGHRVHLAMRRRSAVASQRGSRWRHVRRHGCPRYRSPLNDTRGTPSPISGFPLALGPCPEETMRAVVTALFVAAGIAFTAPVFAQGAGGGSTLAGRERCSRLSRAGPRPAAARGNPECSDASGSNCPDGDFTERAAVARLCLERPSPTACAGRSARRRKLAGRDQGIGQGDRSQALDLSRLLGPPWFVPERCSCPIPAVAREYRLVPMFRREPVC